MDTHATNAAEFSPSMHRPSTVSMLCSQTEVLKLRHYSVNSIACFEAAHPDLTKLNTAMTYLLTSTHAYTLMERTLSAPTTYITRVADNVIMSLLVTGSFLFAPWIYPMCSDTREMLLSRY
jgi:hypothetical protein